MEFTIEGHLVLNKVLKELPDKVKKKVIRPAMMKALTPVVKSFRSKLPEESGASKRAAGKRVKIYKGEGTVVGIVGMRTQHREEYKGQTRRPSKYLHLLEWGWTDKAGKHIPAHPCLEPAFRENKAKAMDILAAQTWAGIRKNVL